MFGVEMLVLTPRMERSLISFQHRSARRLTRRQPRRRGGGSWEYSSFEEAVVEAGFEGIGENITRRKNTAALYILTRPILDLCERSSRRPGARVSWRWWEQDGLDLEGGKKRATAESDGEEAISEEEGIPLGKRQARNEGKGTK